MKNNQQLLINPEADKQALQATMKAMEKYSHGGARPGAGRKRQDTEARSKTMAISGTETEIETIRQLAKASGKTTSRFLIELALEGTMTIRMEKNYDNGNDESRTYRRK